MPGPAVTAWTRRLERTDHDASAAARNADIETTGAYVDAMTTQLGRYSELLAEADEGDPGGAA